MNRGTKKGKPSDKDNWTGKDFDDMMKKQEGADITTNRGTKKGKAGKPRDRPEPEYYTSGRGTSRKKRDSE